MFATAYKELKFIVNVRVVENRVNSHVGKVYEIQNRMLGSTPNVQRSIRPSNPSAELGAACVVSGAALPVCRDCSALAIAAVDTSMRDLAAADAAMIMMVICRRDWKARKVTSSNPPQIYRSGVGNQRP